MNRSELVRKKSREWNMTLKETRTIVDQIFQSIGTLLEKDGRLELRGFGVFEVKNRDSTKGRIPGTGEEVEVPRRKVPTFSAGKNLKESISDQ